MSTTQATRPRAPRRATGQVIEKDTTRGTTYALRFLAMGKRQYMHLGAEDEGWSRARARDELVVVMAQVRNGTWRPPEPAAPAPEISDPTFHEFVSEWWDAKRRELRPTTVSAYEYEIRKHLLPHFADHRLSQITAREIDAYRAAKVRQAEAGARLSNETINKTLGRLAQILDDAVDYELLAHNPARGKKRRLKTTAPNRTHVDRAGHITALLDAARDLDRRARVDRGHARRPLLATLVFADLRIGEALDLRWRDIDLAGGRLHVGRSKTDAGVRDVDLLSVLLDELKAHKAATPNARPDGFVFATAKGGRQSESNVRNRALAKSITLANERLDDPDDVPLPDGLTPHSLRRTFASLLIAKGESPMYVMAQMGHTDPKFTLRVYAKEMSRRDGEPDRLAVIVGAASTSPTGDLIAI